MWLIDGKSKRRIASLGGTRVYVFRKKSYGWPVPCDGLVGGAGLYGRLASCPCTRVHPLCA